MNPEKFEVHGVAIVQDYSWYTEQNIDYLVFGEGMYGRFYNRPDLFQPEIQAYEHLFDQLEPVKFFNDGGYEVRIYRMRK